MRERLERFGPLSDWIDFAASWNTLEPDTYLATVGLHRRRRHAVFSATRESIVREVHQPHYQSRDYNTLQGGIERWFAPVLPEIADSASLHSILRFCLAFFGALAPDVPEWHIELHQFRIEARAGEPGQPTPEGVHRDVLVVTFRRKVLAAQA